MRPYPEKERIDLTTILTTTLFGNESEGSDPIWSNDDWWQEAETRYWYRKFYTETKTGQLMLLRPDEPATYCYTKDQLQAAALGFINRRLHRVNVLLALLTILALIAIIAALWR